MRIRLFIFTLFFFGMLGPSWPPLSIHAQDGGEPGTTLPGGTIAGSVTFYLPLISSVGEALPSPTPSPIPSPIPSPTPTTTVTFTVLSVQGPPVDRLPATNPDLNLSVRSYVSTTATLGLVNIDGTTDAHAPQLVGIFSPPRLPAFTAVYQVYDWNWACSADGCRSSPITVPKVTLLEMAVTPGEALFIPSRDLQIHAGGYIALVLYAEETRITLTYTREDTPARGYLVHLEDVQVDPTLLALYRAQDAAGRKQLPALHNQERFANAIGSTIKVAIRDTGSFMDPRARKDWWMGFQNFGF